MSVSVSVRLLPAAALLVLAACVSPNAAPRLGPAGEQASQRYEITEKNLGAIRQRALETLNTTRAEHGRAALALDPRLTEAAMAQSRSMSQQRRAWHFDAKGTSPLDRAQRAGYGAGIVGEVVSDTYETEVQTIATWMGSPEQAAILTSPAGQAVGIGVQQDADGRNWWTLVMGR